MAQIYMYYDPAKDMGLSSQWVDIIDYAVTKDRCLAWFQFRGPATGKLYTCILNRKGSISQATWMAALSALGEGVKLGTQLFDDEENNNARIKKTLALGGGFALGGFLKEMFLKEEGYYDANTKQLLFRGLQGIDATNFRV